MSEAQTTTVPTPDHRAVLRQASAVTALEPLGPGGSIVTLTFGQFSIGDILRALLDRTGPADVTISTWTAAKAEIEYAFEMIEDGRIRSMRWLVDRSFATRQPEYCARLLERFGPDAIRTTRTHAKWATIVGGDWAFAVRTSCNLNRNDRLELVEVSDSRELAGWFNAIADDLWSQLPSEQMNAELPAGATTNDPPSKIRMGEKVRFG